MEYLCIGHPRDACVGFKVVFYFTKMFQTSRVTCSASFDPIQSYFFICKMRVIISTMKGGYGDQVN